MVEGIRKNRHPFLLAASALSLVAAGSWAPSAKAADDPQKLPEVTVTSTTIDDRFESKRDEPSNISVISGEKVDRAHVENMIQVLQSIPGVTADLSSGDEIKIKLRGIENQRYMGEKPGVAIVIDGVPVFERTGKVNIDLDNIESIKVIKGGASYLFGDDGLSGAVIITTKRGAKYAGYTLSGETGSFGYTKGIARAGFSGEKGSGHLQVSRRQSDDYYFQSAYKTDYVDGNFQYYLSGTSDLTFSFEKSEREKDKHGSVTGKTQADIDPRGFFGRDYTRKYDVELQKLSLTYSNTYDDKSNLLVSGYEYRDHTIFWSAPQKYNLAGTQAVTSPDAYTTNNDYHQVQRGLKGEWRSAQQNVGWLTGLDLRRNTYQNYNTAKVDYCTRVSGGACAAGAAVTAGTVLQNDSTDEAVNAIYGEAKFIPATAWTLTFNGRYDNIDLDYSSGQTNSAAPLSLTKSFDVTSWRGGANYAASDSLDFYGNLSTGFRAPSIQQLFTGTISPSSSGKTANNENLKPEQALNIEFGARTKFSVAGIGFDADAAIFQIDRKDFILAVSGQYAGTSASFPEKYDNIGGVRNRGFELSLKSDKRRAVSVDVAYTYIDARFTRYDNFSQILGNQYGAAWVAGAFNPLTQYKLVSHNNAGKSVPRVPTHQLNLTTNWYPTERVRLGLEMDTKSWSYADEINQEQLPGRTLFNLLANYDIKTGMEDVKGGKWSFFARVDNLFDRDYWVIARGTNDAQSYANNFKYDGKYNAEDLSIVVGRGRTWTAGLAATF